MSARSTTTPSAWQMYCCFSRDLSVRCSMLNEMPELRAPENKRTGMEISPKVKCPDQTEAAIVPSVHHVLVGKHGLCGNGRLGRPVERSSTHTTEPSLTHPELRV